MRINGSIPFWRGYHNDFFYAGDFGGNRPHENGRNQRGFPANSARYVDPDRINRCDQLAKERAWSLGINPGFLQLLFVKCLDLSDCTFTFQKPDKERFPCLEIARDAAAGGGSYPLCFNASNEAAVAAFAEGRIKFTEIARVISSCLDGDWGNLLISFDQIFEMDELARRVAGEIIDKLA